MQLTSSILVWTTFSWLGCHCLTIANPTPEPATVVPNPMENAVRSTTTCADPSIAQTFYQGFNGANVIHVVNLYYQFANYNTATRSAFWVDLRPAFLAWRTQQQSTVPLFALANAGGTEYIFSIGTDAQTPPVISGFSSAGLIAWVYSTPVCGSVPLVSAGYAAATDHFYTTDIEEHDALVGLPGWADTGVVAYVLPLTFS